MIELDSNFICYYKLKHVSNIRQRERSLVFEKIEEERENMKELEVKEPLYFNIVFAWLL